MPDPKIFYTALKPADDRAYRARLADGRALAVHCVARNADEPVVRREDDSDARAGRTRLLLRRLRESAEPSPRRRARPHCHPIASNMVAEVCPPVVRADAPELFVTEGLNREAVHLTTMRPGEGLVAIASSAEPLALSDAQHHPAFSAAGDRRRDLSSFLGVPVLRGGATIGVLVVQNRARRTYSEEEVSAADHGDASCRDDRPGELQGWRRKRSIASRQPFVARSDCRWPPASATLSCTSRVWLPAIVADDVESELQRLGGGDRRNARLRRRPH